MKPCLGEMFSHHASAESTLPPSGYLAPIVCWLILQELLHFHFLEGELAQSVSGQLKRTPKGTWGRTRSSVEVSSNGVIVVDWHSNWKVIENRSISSQAPWCCGHVRDKFFPNSFDAAASVKEAQLFTTGHFRRGGGAVWGRQGWRGRGEDGRCNTSAVRAEWSDMSSGVWQFLSAPSVRLSITRRLKKKKRKTVQRRDARLIRELNKRLGCCCVYGVVLGWWWLPTLRLFGLKPDVSQQPEAAGLF